MTQVPDTDKKKKSDESSWYCEKDNNEHKIRIAIDVLRDMLGQARIIYVDTLGRCDRKITRMLG